MKSGECIMDGQFPNYDAYCVIESDDEEDTNSSDQPQDIIAGIDTAVDMFFEDHNELIDDQITKCNDYLDKSLRNCTLEANFIDNLGTELQNEITSLRNELYKPYKPVIKHVDPIDIFEDSKKSDKDIIAVNRTICSVPADLPKEGPLEYPQFKQGDLLYGMKFTLKQPWFKCKIKSVMNDGNVHLLFDSEEKVLQAKEVASFEESPVRFPVGCRIISKFTEIDSDVDYYYAGIIAEPPNLINRFR